MTNGGVTESYTYDADGEQVAKTVGGVTTVYFQGLWEQIVGGASTRYYPFNGQVVAIRDSATNAVTYLHGDHLGSVSLATDSSGAVVSRQGFDPWGKARGTGTIPQTSLNYTGQRLDGTGLLYYHARYYDPVLARFVSADTMVPGQDSKTGTANPQHLNRYAYVGNNPLTRTDPSGHDWEHLAQFASGVAEGVGQVAVSTVQAAADSISPITAVKQTVEFVSDPSGYVSSRVQAVADTATTAYRGGQSLVSDPSGAAATLYEHSHEVGQVMGEALGTAGMAAGVNALGSATIASAAPDLGTLDKHALSSMAKRGWTKEQIMEAFENGKAHSAIDKTAGDTPATRYVHPKMGKSVVVNNETGRVVHVGGEGYHYDK